jgi:GNAT superfamily N-acetyltransferase
MPLVGVTRTYLELRGPGELRAARPPAQPPRLERRHPIGPDEYLALYTLVGAAWFWRERLTWSDAALAAHLAAPNVQVWVATLDDVVAGYFELMVAADGDSTEIKYFGLSAPFIGRGLGGWLLTRACETAFALGAARVVLETCTLDGPHALPNYLARGFRIVRDEVYQVDLPG